MINRVVRMLASIPDQTNRRYPMRSPRFADTLLITDTDPCMDDLAGWMNDLGAGVVRRSGAGTASWLLAGVELIDQLSIHVSNPRIRTVIVCGHPQRPAREASDTGTAAGSAFNRMVARIAAAQRAAEDGRRSVLEQADSLRSHGVVRRREMVGTLQVHAWFYLPETATILQYDPEQGWIPWYGRQGVSSSL